MIFNRERPSFEAANNIIVNRCFFAYEFATNYINKESTIYDIGCADGYGTSYLSSFCKHITGLDYSKNTIKHAKEKFSNISNIAFKDSKVPPLSIYSEKADLITAFQFIEHIQNRELFIREVKRALRLGGVFICTTPNRKKSLARNPYHVYEYTFDEMKKEIAKHFDDYTILGLHGNEMVNAYYRENQKWVNKILKYDVLGIHKILPSASLQLPYNLLTSIMRTDLLKKDKLIPTIKTTDFYLSPDNLDEAIDIFVIARKTKRSGILRNMRFLFE